MPARRTRWHRRRPPRCEGSSRKRLSGRIGPGPPPHAGRPRPVGRALGNRAAQPCRAPSRPATLASSPMPGPPSPCASLSVGARPAGPGLAPAPPADPESGRRPGRPGRSCAHDGAWSVWCRSGPLRRLGRTPRRRTRARRARAKRCARAGRAVRPAGAKSVGGGGRGERRWLSAGGVSGSVGRRRRWGGSHRGTLLEAGRGDATRAPCSGGAEMAERPTRIAMRSLQRRDPDREARCRPRA
jgi:hypothetical protein